MNHASKRYAVAYGPGGVEVSVRDRLRVLRLERATRFERATIIPGEDRPASVAAIGPGKREIQLLEAAYMLQTVCRDLLEALDQQQRQIVVPNLLLAEVAATVSERGAIQFVGA